jgi:hypothetical protein
MEKSDAVNPRNPVSGWRAGTAAAAATGVTSAAHISWWN